MDIKVHKKETRYFILKIIFSILVLLCCVNLITYANRDFKQMSAAISVIVLYAAIIVAFVFFQKVYLVAHMKGNGICISEQQFPEIYASYHAMAQKLEMKKIPKLFILQQGGMLNAFAIRFSCKTYIAVYTDIFAVHETDPDALKFVIGHELGHVKRMHMSKRFWTMPSAIIPFLSKAYSRACEYTCDNIGGSLTDSGKQNGLLLLAGGKDLYKKVNVRNYLEEAERNKSFSVRLVGLFMTHPYLPQRLENISRTSD